MDAAEFFLIQRRWMHAADVGDPGSMGDRMAGGPTPLDVGRATRANRLGATAIAHNALHLGEAVAIRGQLGLGVGM
ncbi:MAG TPA: hypothetical protein VFV05_21190 [Methylomirabilota bacterium]|nr:hypothetical protein [Methylomirabilota bacterium]